MECVVRYDTCPACLGEITKWRDKTNSYGRFAIDRCSRCGHAFVNPRPRAEVLAEFYRDYGQGDTEIGDLEDVLSQEAAYPNSTLDARRIISTARRLTGGAGRLLDVGCGYGFFSKEAKDQGFQVAAIDIAPGETIIPRQLAGVPPGNVAFEDYDSNEKFDVILFSQMLEHAHDVNTWVSKAARLLRSGGALVIALPNFDSIFRYLLRENDPYVTPPVHLNFFTYRSLCILLRRHGLSVAAHHMFSRFPERVISRRLGRFSFLGGPLYWLANLGMRRLDGTRLAMLFDVYAIKEDVTI
jgi:SAM-dependent methyltransferase